MFLELVNFLVGGLTKASIWEMVAYTLVMTHITMISVTVYLHRHSAHRSVDVHPALGHFFRFWLWVTTSMNTKEWTAVHRKHHAFCETEDDPHSPVVNGLGQILSRGAEYYADAATEETLDRYGRGTPDDWMERNVYGRHQQMGILAMFIINVALFGVAGITIWAIQMAWTPIFAAGVINGIGHAFGYRNFECPDAATNISPWGILIAGEELHNNHHTYPNSAKLSVKPWEFDIGWMYIRLFEMVGLAKALSTGPVVEQDPNKAHLDMDTVWALLNDRFRVMSRYADEVVKPVVVEAKAAQHAVGKSAKGTFRRAKAILTREEILVSDKDRARIGELVDTSPALKTVYDMRMRLQEIWAKRGGNSDELLASLKQWCADAEASGIRAMREFAEELKSYTIPAKAATA